MSLNVEVARILYELGEIYTIRGEVFRSRAYIRAAQQIESHPDDVEKLYEAGGLERIPGVGKGVAAIIEEYLTTGQCLHLEELRETLPIGLRELMNLEGVGPKTAMQLNKELNIVSIDQLEVAARSGEIRKLKGFGPKSEKNILLAIHSYRSMQRRSLLGQILPLVREIEEYMATSQYVLKVEAAGSARRMKETVGDLDILVASNNRDEVINHFTSMPRVSRIISKGTTQSTVVLGSTFQVDLRVVPPDSYGAALQYFTGSKEHNIRLRTVAVKLGYKLNEYGVFKRDLTQKVAGETEESIYQTLGLDFIVPELREDRGEIEAAALRTLPSLIEYGEVKGDLHVHSRWSDGLSTLAEIAEAAQKYGLEYVAICDHSKALGVANGLDEERLRAQMVEIDTLNKGFNGFQLLKGIEVDITADGTLDLSNSVLKDLDFVVAAIHSGFKSTPERMTERIISAIYNEYVSVLGHPTGRLLNRRQPYPLHLDEVFRVAAEQGVMMEINAFPNRLDLNDVNSRDAAEQGVLISIGTDAHTINQIRYLQLGTSVARRGWLKRTDVVNTLNASKLLKNLKR